MEFALVDGERKSPTKGKRGVCQYCSGEMVAKCGRMKMWHWAHKPKSSCDPWWGPETEWHRQWKEIFPESWREVVHIDEETGERHIADVKTPHGLVLEFQHSPLDRDERISREAFYENMIWIVDGRSGSLSLGNFSAGFSSEPIEYRPVVHLVKWWKRSGLLHGWAEAKCPVYIDFGWRGLWYFRDFSAEHDVGAFSPLEKEWLVEACQEGESIPQAWVEEGEEEAYISLWQPIEVKPKNQD